MQELVVRAQAGDRDAFSQLAARSIGRLTAVARMILRDEYAAQDAVQEAFILAWRSLPGLREPDKFEAWLRRAFHRAREEGGVTLSTIHRVKGREWDRVAVFGVSDGLVPHRLADDLEEGRPEVAGYSQVSRRSLEAA